MDKLLLHSVYNRKTNQQVLPQYSNRVCELTFSIEDKTYMILKFENGGTLKHFEHVIDICEDDYGVWINTVSKDWRFDNI